MASARPTVGGRPGRAAGLGGVRVFTGGHDARGLRFGIVSSRYNELFADAILEGAVKTLTARGASREGITVTRVSGAWEIPVIAREMAQSKAFDSILGLGVLIEGETAHFDLIGREVAHGLAQVALESGVPVLFGVVTARNERQAAARTGGTRGNRGEEVAMAAIEAALVMRRVKVSLKGKAKVRTQ